ncbi:MAG: NAD(P)H-dependent oxidoreductase [Acidimicrobiaceae bacterium]|nr:NAD(P)H-dependent oxidoreductase [Acidimicrobiaceae bacterium]MBT5849870.1 NAD(P)H-dependent oxidoreductase [Acidimicrobiaceae bacterium]
MRVFLLDAFPLDSPDRIVVDEALSTLRSGGHQVIHRVLVGGPFEAFMSSAEREAYHGETPLSTPEAIEDAAILKEVDALLFCYPTILFTIPSVLKSWLERVLVPGVAFVFDHKERIRPGMRNIHHLGTITSTPHNASVTRRRRDAGRRTTMRTLRLSCRRFCRCTVVAVSSGSPEIFKIKRALGRW